MRTSQPKHNATALIHKTSLSEQPTGYLVVLAPAQKKMDPDLHLPYTHTHAHQSRCADAKMERNGTGSQLILC